MNCKTRYWFLLTWLATSSLAYGQQQEIIEYRNAIWWDGRIEISGSRFVRGTEFVNGNAGSVDTIVDLSDAVVTAPFGEGHNHNLISMFFDHANREYLRNGVFYVKIPGVHPPAVEPIRRTLDRMDTVDATFSLGSITSPGGHPVTLFVDVLAEPVYEGAKYQDFAGKAFHEVVTEADVLTAVEILNSQGTDFVKAILAYSEEYDDGYHDGMDPSLLPVLVRAAHAKDLEVSLHVDSAEDFRAGIRAGVDEIAHIPGLVWPPTRNPEQHLLTQSDAQQAADAGIPVVTTTHFQNVISEMFSIDDNRIAEFKEVHRHNLTLLIQAGVEIRIGSDVYDRLGNGLGANPTRGEIENLVRLGAFDSTAVLSRWIDTGRKIFPGRRIGCFDVGCEASFLVFEADPRVDLENLDRMRLAIKQGFDVTQSSAQSVAAE